MDARHAVLAAATAAAVALAPMAAVAAPAAKPDKPVKPVKPNFSVSKLTILKHKKKVDVATKDAVIKARVKVKDKSKAFDPTKVKLVVTEKETGEAKDTFVVDARLRGKSKVVSNWQAKITVPAGSVEPGATAVYCIKLVKVNDGDPSTLPVTKLAKGLRGRDCVKVVNSAEGPSA